jgi:hypothetical protein
MGSVVEDHLGRLMLGVAPLLPAEPIDRTTSGGHRQPAARVGRCAVDRPAFEGDHERLTGRLLGDIKITEAADQ